MNLRIDESVVCAAQRSQCQLVLSMECEGRVGAYALTVVVGGVSREAAKLRRKCCCGHWGRRCTGPWALPSDHQSEITSSPAECSDCFHKDRYYHQSMDEIARRPLTTHSTSYPVLMLGQKTLNLLGASTALEKQPTTLRTIPGHATTVRRGRNDHIGL